MRKILFVNNFSKPDYLNDCLFHGLNQLDLNIEVTNDPFYMNKSYDKLNSLYGRGFTLYGTLDIIPTIESNPEEKILNKYYDTIIYGSVHRDRSYSNLVFKVYPKDSILCVDGEDDAAVYEPFVKSSVYFKRELIHPRKDLKNVSFAIPEEKILEEISPKTKMFATVIPGDLGTYQFYNERDYYLDYASSFYGHTTRKAGWDCLRHYEILAAGCIPCFKDLDKCPESLMKTYPKEIILEMNDYSLQGKISPNYDEVLKYLVIYTKENLTTKHLATKVLS